MNIVVTGGLGFIGSHFVDLLVKRGVRPIVVDALTYAGHRENLRHLPDDAYRLEVIDIADAAAVARVLREGEVDAVFNLAAETHVDRSIEGPAAFVQTNVVGTSVLLAECLKYWDERKRPANFRYVQISTDEVYGALEDDTSKFNEAMAYEPNSPYSASKAGGDHLVRAYHRTYGLPALVTHCSNNYGPRQFPEKLIPAVMRRALEGKPLGVYGDGQHVRDWLHVEDHCRGIWLAFEKGRPGEHYCFGGGLELKNLDLVHALCDVLNEVRPAARNYRDLITFVPDRLGHDRRYAVEFSKAHRELGYQPAHRFHQAFRETLEWYLNNQDWVAAVGQKEHQ